MSNVGRVLRVRRIVAWVLAILVAISGAVLLALNLYVQSQATQIRIQQELSQRLGMPLRIHRISVTPWNGLNLSGIVIPDSRVEDKQPFLTAQDLRLYVRFRSIFWRPLVIKEVALIKPVVLWSQNQSGKWRLPSNSRALPDLSAAGTTPPSAGATLNGLATPVPPSKIGLPQNEPAGFDANAPQIKRVNLIDGTFHFFDRENRTVALFDGVRFLSTVRDLFSIRGEARVSKVRLRDRVSLSELRSPVRYDPEKLELSALSARIAKGKLSGSFQMQPQLENSPFSLEAHFDGVQADQVVTDAGGPAQVVRGILEGTIKAAGNTAHAVTGEGRIALRNGQVQQFTVLAAIGQLLQIEELTRLDLQQAEAQFHFANRQILVDELVLRSPNLRLNANGSVSYEGKLALNSTLTINEKIRGQLFRAIRENFAATGEPGEYALPFQISGTVEKPKTDLMQRAVGADLKNLGGVIDALFGRGKKKNPSSTPEPSAASTP